MIDASFRRAVCELPNEDGPRLVYADWLDERGEADRAAFIRLQCEIARRFADNERHRCARPSRYGHRHSLKLCRWCRHLEEVKPLCDRARRMMIKNRAKWVPKALIRGDAHVELPFVDPAPALTVVPAEYFGRNVPLRAILTIHRGFLVKVVCDYANWARAAASIWPADPAGRRHPLEQVILTSWPSFVFDPAYPGSPAGMVRYRLAGCHEAGDDGGWREGLNEEVSVESPQYTRRVTRMVRERWPGLRIEFDGWLRAVRDHNRRHDIVEGFV